MSYADALDFLDTLTNYERVHRPSAMRKMPLERMRALCARLGHPQRRFRSILVGGTSGKGSICTMAAAILRAAGLRTGLYLSPHIQEVRERIQLVVPGGERARWIGKEEFAALVAQLLTVLEDLGDNRTLGPVTYFEAMTALAFVYFAHQHVAVAVLEVGLGGRLDATNVVDPAVSVLGPIGMDHADVLGKDVGLIAAEKAGIMRPKRPVLIAAQSPEALTVLRHAAARHGAKLYEYGTHLSATVRARESRGQHLTITGMRARYQDLTLPLIGVHQAENAALAVGAVELLSAHGAPHRAVRAGLARVRHPGRLEVVQDHPLVALDGAHNPPAVVALREALRAWWSDRAIHLILGMSADKAKPAVVKSFGSWATSVTCTQSRHPRACDAQVLRRRVGRSCQAVTAIADSHDAYTYVLNTCSTNDVIVVTGSLFLVGELRAALRRGATPARRILAAR